jgi:magnesium chelatase subunit I
MTPSPALPSTLGALKSSGYQSKSVKQELRDNLMAALAQQRPLFPGIVGYDRTVLRDVQNAILSRHDFILLGLRGQAKTRILRSLDVAARRVDPVVAGCEIRDDPLRPFCAACRDPHRMRRRPHRRSPGSAATIATTRSWRRRT